MTPSVCSFSFFFFNDTATTEIYTLSLHDALPISRTEATKAEITENLKEESGFTPDISQTDGNIQGSGERDRKSTRLNSSHSQISYAVFCLKKKKKQHNSHHTVTTHALPPTRCTHN